MEFKKMNADTYKNKSRNKNWSKVIPKDKKGSKINHNVSETDVSEHGAGGLQNNWDRYEQRDEEFTADASKDFALLSEAPLYQGNFQFKSDKLIIEDTSALIQKNAFFELDLNFLNQSIQTVPFHERVGIDKKYFSEDALKDMYENADKATKEYVALLKEKTSTTPGLEHIDDINIDSTLAKAVEGVSLSDEEDLSSDEDTGSDVSAEDLNTEDLNTENINIEDINSKDLNTEDRNTENLNTENLNTEHLNPEDNISARLEVENIVYDSVTRQWTVHFVDPIKPVDMETIVEQNDVNCGTAEEFPSNITVHGFTIKKENPEDLEQWLDDILDS